MGDALVTGAAGFIGSHLVDRLLAEGWCVTAVDNFDPFYPPAVKRRNIAAHVEHPSYSLVEADLRDLDAMRSRLCGEYDVIVHLAAKAGVRPSISDPFGFYDVNVRGTQNLLELARIWRVRQFVFASSSSVYGVNPSVPWQEEDHVLLPISPYAGSKVSGELLGHVYSHLYGMRFLALRFFTVYGPRQRPDLAIHKFSRSLLHGDPIHIFGDGSSSRDYTFIDDIVVGIRAAMSYTATDYEILNIGNHSPTGLLELVRLLEDASGRRAAIVWDPDQPGDVPRTWADISKATRLLGYQPQTSITQGLRRFLGWFDGEPEYPSVSCLSRA